MIEIGENDFTFDDRLGDTVRQGRISSYRIERSVFHLNACFGTNKVDRR